MDYIVTAIVVGIFALGTFVTFIRPLLTTNKD